MAAAHAAACVEHPGCPAAGGARLLRRAARLADLLQPPLCGACRLRVFHLRRNPSAPGVSEWTPIFRSTACRMCLRSGIRRRVTGGMDNRYRDSPQRPGKPEPCGTPYQSASRVAARAGGIQLPSPREPGNHRAQGSGRRSRLPQAVGSACLVALGLGACRLLDGLAQSSDDNDQLVMGVLDVGSGIRLITRGDTLPATDRRPLPDARSR